MSQPIDLVLSRLDGYKLRHNGRDRWRSCCPAHGGSNPSALSIGIGDNGGCLLKCWQGCSVDQVAGALGLDLQDLFPPQIGSGPQRKRRLLSAAQVMDLAHAEVQLVAHVASAIGQQRFDDVTPVDCARVLQAAARLACLVDEVHA